MHLVVEVGSRLDPDVSWPEGAALTMFAGEPVQLMMFLSCPHELEVQAVAAAPTRFAWIDSEHAGILAYRLGPVLSWSQAPYNPHLFAPEDGLPGVDVDGTVQIVLVDRDTNIVKALHRVEWPPDFAATVRASVTRMREMPFSRPAYEHALAALHRRCPTAEDLVVDRADALCTATPVPLTDL
ncbi:hypothetical protein M1L60_00515 [Actinoplanes sp. TRM 88003]|uniref:Uncharacterized protein n=1 Tax=Paractinoplanes aksuensis TaxID=2939490 RepID=A0ABT1DG85_9ACTN|nr:hypothetical protein [Actinoplanes aksuensis]MCO8269065.1 hypothetical protein [Actinoplanes aksuensis]